VTPDLYLLAVLVMCGVTVQTTAGFGAMLVCVTLGALRWPIADLVPVLIPVMLLQSAWIVIRHRQQVRWGFLMRRVLPTMLLGMVTAMLLTGRDVSQYRPILGVLILSLGVRELFRQVGSPTPPVWQSQVGVFGAGVIHGLFATGGPLLVWSVSRESFTKTQLRTTLNAVWMLLNSVMVSIFIFRGQATAETLTRSAWMIPAIGIGLVWGERLHHRVDETRFRRLVWVILCFAAIPLLIPH
jgi:uncharacterized membrane protein YfcA